VATAALAAGVAGLVLIPAPRQAQRYQVEAGAQRLVCADGTPQVCVTAVHAYALPAAVPEVRRALAALAKLPGAPTRAAEFRPDTVGTGVIYQFWGDQPKIEPGTVLFDLELGFQRATDPDLAMSIVYGAGTLWNGCKQDDFAAKAAAGAWLLGTDDLPLAGADWTVPRQVKERVPETVRKLRELPEKEQVKRVTALRDAANRCVPDLLPILTGERATS
jgi:hypothetical protein